MAYYNETDYKDKTFTIHDADVRESGGACPFQATGSVGGEFFYFRLRNGYASLEVGSDYSDGVNVDNASHGYLDGVCSTDEFEEIFDELIAQYRQAKNPVASPTYARLSFSDATILHKDEYSIRGEIDDSDFELEIENGTVTLKVSSYPDEYERVLKIGYGEYGDMYSGLDDEYIEEVFNILIADFS